jgi:hypothetical protein
MGKMIGWALFIAVLVIGFLYFYGMSPEDHKLPPPPSTPSTTVSAPAWTVQSLQQRINEVIEASPDMKQVKMMVEVQQLQGKEATIHTTWEGDVAVYGGDFVKALFDQQVIRDFDEKGASGRWADQDGRSHWTQDFILKFR